MMIDYSAYDEEFKPEDPFFGDSADILDDGDYEFTIREAVLTEAKNKGIVKFKLEIMTEGKHQASVINHSVWISDADSAKRFGAILKGFGFDCDEWKPANGRTFSTEMPKSIRWLVGMRVKAKKSTSKVAPKYAKDTEKTYHNLNFRGRSGVDDGLPRTIGPEQLNAPDPNAEEDPFKV